MTVPKSVNIYEVCPREGLQSQERVLDTTVKQKLIHNLVDSGLRHIETTAFFHPQHFPQLADAAKVIQEVDRSRGVRYSAHVPNQRGMERAREAGLDAVIFCVSVADEVARRSPDHCASSRDCLDHAYSLAEVARKHRMWRRLFLVNVWGSPYEGRIDPKRVQGFVREAVDLDFEQICLADTLAAATPSQVEEVLDVVLEVAPVERLALHFHDNRGMAVANVMAGLNHGVTTFDSSVGGYGGHANCQYIPRNPRMLATEDLLFLFHGLGIETGVDLETVRMAGHWLSRALDQAPLGQYSLAGPLEVVA